jgi:hypothetical protein
LATEIEPPPLLLPPQALTSNARSAPIVPISKSFLILLSSSWSSTRDTCCNCVDTSLDCGERLVKVALVHRRGDEPVMPGVEVQPVLAARGREDGSAGNENKQGDKSESHEDLAKQE